MAQNHIRAPRLTGVTASRSRRVAAVYGLDLESGHPAFDAESLISNGFELLALDRPAVAELLERQLPFRTAEDWLVEAGNSPSAVYALASSVAKGWTNHEPSALTSEGLLWSDLDYWHVPETWLAVTVALRLVVAFQRASVTELRYSYGYRFSEHMPREVPLAPVATLWTRLLPSIAAPISMQNLPSISVRSRLREAVSGSLLGGPLRGARSTVAATRFRIAAKRLLSEPGRSRPVLLMLPAREMKRSSPIIQILRGQLGDALISVPWMDSNVLTAEAGSLHEIAWLPTPPFERGFRRDERRLKNGIERNLRSHDLGGLEPARPELVAALQSLALGWAAHARRLRWAVKMLKDSNPRLVITARDALPYPIPTEASRSAGVPVVTLPHGIVEWSPPDRLRPQPGITHVGGIENPTAPADGLRYCRDVLIRYEYPHRVKEFIDRGTPGDLQVLVLTEGYGTWNQPSLNIRDHQVGLRLLESVAGRFGSEVRMLLKPHPGELQDEQNLIGDGPLLPRAVTILPRETDVIAAITASDLVIGLNYIGSALFHAVDAGRPTVRLTTSHSLKLKPSEATLTAVAAWAAFWDRMLLSVEDADGLVEVLRRMKDPAFVEELRQRSHEAVAALRPDADAPSIVDVVEEILATRTAQNS